MMTPAMVTCALSVALLSQLGAEPEALRCPPDTRLAESKTKDGLERWCERLDVYAGRFVRHGPSETWHSNGTLTYRGAFLDGQMSGLWREWTPAGTLRVQARYDRGLLHGAYREHRSSGELIEANYSRGKRDGSWRVLSAAGIVVEHGLYQDDQRIGAWVVSLEDGRQLKGRFARDQPHGPAVITAGGVIRERGRFQEGDRVGVWSMFDEAGVLEAQGPIVKDVRDGAWTLFEPTGRKRAIGTYRQGARTGVWTEWVGDGTRALGTYRGDHRDGHWKIVRGALGRIVAEGRYRRGKRHGRWRFYDDGGALAHTLRYRAGRLKRGKTTAFDTRDLR